jgi:hypothetical protein
MHYTSLFHHTTENGAVCPLECAALTSRTHRSTVVSCRENHRRPFTLILGKLRVQHQYQTGNQRELKDAQSSNSNSNLNLFTFTFHFHYLHQPYQLAQQMNFSPVNKTVCPLECAALTSCKKFSLRGFTDTRSIPGALGPYQAAQSFANAQKATSFGVPAAQRVTCTIYVHKMMIPLKSRYVSR